MITQGDRKILVNYRIGQAKEMINTVEVLLTTVDLRSTVSRIYYGMFYMLLAIAAKNGFETSKHKQLIGWFNKNFVNEGLLPNNYGKLIMKTYQHRIEGDYEVYIEFERQDVEKMFEDMKDFIFTIEKYLKEDGD